MPETDRKMKLSIAGGSGWDAGIVLLCGQMHFLKYEMAWKLKKMPGYFAFGILFHEAYFKNDIEIFKKGWKEGRLYDEDKDDDPGIEIDREESKIAENISTAEQMFTVVQNEKLEIIETEKMLETPIIDPETGKTPEHLEGVVVAGRSDLVEIYEGEEQMGDLKTAQRKWSEAQALGGIQLPTYRYLRGCLGLKTHDKGNYLVITKTKNPAFQRLPVKMGSADFFAVYEQFRQAAERIIEYRKAKRWPKNHKACIGSYGQLCQYHSICFPERYDNPEKLVNEKFVSRA